MESRARRPGVFEPLDHIVPEAVNARLFNYKASKFLFFPPTLVVFKSVWGGFSVLGKVYLVKELVAFLGLTRSHSLCESGMHCRLSSPFQACQDG